MTGIETALFLLSGAFGSMTKDIVRDNKLRLPKVVDGELVLGFIGGMVIGAFVGWVVDQSLITAALSGYVGVEVIGHLLPRDNKPPRPLN